MKLRLKKIPKPRELSRDQLRKMHLLYYIKHYKDKKIPYRNIKPYSESEINELMSVKLPKMKDLKLDQSIDYNYVLAPEKRLKRKKRKSYKDNKLDFNKQQKDNESKSGRFYENRKSGWDKQQKDTKLESDKSHKDNKSDFNKQQKDNESKSGRSCKNRKSR